MTREPITIGILGCLVLIFMMIAFNAALAFVVMLAWNAVIPQTFNLPELDYWKSFALVVLASIILGFARGSVSVAR